MEVFTIFWGAAWQKGAQSARVGQINQFLGFILSSALIDQLAEYSGDICVWKTKKVRAYTVQLNGPTKPTSAFSSCDGIPQLFVETIKI